MHTVQHTGVGWAGGWRGARRLGRAHVTIVNSENVDVGRNMGRHRTAQVGGGKGGCCSSSSVSKQVHIAWLYSRRPISVSTPSG